MSEAESAAERERLAAEIAAQLAVQQRRERQAELDRAAAAEARRHRDHVAALQRDLRSKVYSTRWQAYEELRSMGRKVDAVPLWLLDLELHPDDDVREKAAENLGRAQDHRAIKQLRWSSQYDDDFGVRGACEDALEAMGLPVDD
jgi:hypothetical protein